MNDNTAQEVARGNGNHMVSFIVGAAIGAGIALLVAPSSGAVTRRRLGQTASRVRTSLGENMAKARNRVHDLSSGVGGRLGELKDDVANAVETGRQTFVQDREARRMRSNAE